MTTDTVPDRIEKKIVLKAPLSRVWLAISDSCQFGAWFGVEFDGPFVEGQRMIGRMTPTKVDPEVAKSQEPYTGRAFEITVERLQAQRLFSFRWHPFAVDPGFDYSGEPTTMVIFELEETAGGTLLTVTETGFSKIPLTRRATAFRANDGGWSHQVRLIEKYLALHASR